MSYTYEQLDTAKREIALAAITAAMHHAGYGGTAETGFTWMNIPLFPPATAGPFPPVSIPHSPAQVDAWGMYYEPWFDALEDAFADWDGLPEPSGFDGPINAVRAGAKKLNDGTAGSGESAVGHNPQLGDLETIKGELAPFNGPTINTFTDVYVNRLPGVIRSQCQVAYLLGSVLAGEQDLWTKTRTDIAGLATAGLDAMKNAGPSGAGGGKYAITVAAALASGVAVFVTGGTAGLVIGGAAAGLGALSSLMPEPSTPPDNGNDLNAGTPEGVLANLNDAITTLRKQVFFEESDMVTALNAASDYVWDHQLEYNLRPPSGFLNETIKSNIVTAEETAVDLGVMRRIGTVDMPNIAMQLTNATQRLDGAGSVSPWMRPSAIGYGATGPHDQWTSLREQLDAIAVDTAGELVASGEHLAKAAHRFGETDAEARGRLAEHAHSVQDVSAPDPGRPPEPAPPHMRYPDLGAPV